MVVNKSKGFTLIELIIGIVVLAIAMVFMSTLLLSQHKSFLMPLHHFQATRLNEVVVQDILFTIKSKPFVNSSDGDNDLQWNLFATHGFIPAMNYHTLSNQYITSAAYINYQIKVDIIDHLLLPDKPPIKRIDVTIRTPDDDAIVFSVLQGRH